MGCGGILIPLTVLRRIVYSVVFDRKSFVNDVGNEWVDGWMIGKFVN